MVIYYIWKFPKIGYPAIFSGFPINQPFWETPISGNVAVQGTGVADDRDGDRDGDRDRRCLALAIVGLPSWAVAATRSPGPAGLFKATSIGRIRFFAGDYDQIV